MAHPKVFLPACGLIFLASQSAVGQQRFGGGALVGVNASQLDGDQAAGYNKYSLCAGVRGIVYLENKKNISIDLLYSGQGSRSTDNDPVLPFTVKLDYLEIPVLFNYGDWEKKDRNNRAYYKLQFSGGISYSRLFNAAADPSFLINHAPLTLWQKNSFSAVLGATYFVNAHFTVGVKWTSAFTRLFNQNDYNNDPVLRNYNSIRGYFWSLQAGYLF